jgi:NADPH-dependent ferric siderophore reductase
MAVAMCVFEPPQPDPAIAAALNAFAAAERAALLQLRSLVFQVASEDDRIGPLVEELKWGQPSIRPKRAKVGTPMRLGRAKTGQIALFVHCQTSVISEFRAVFPDRFHFDGNRAVLLDPGVPVPVEDLRPLLQGALTYHLR